MHYKKVFQIVLILILLKGLSFGSTQSQIITWGQTEIYKLLAPNETQVKATFTARNEGDIPIRINRIETESNAIKALIKGRIIPPKDSLQIELLFHAENKQGIYNNKVAVYIDNYQNKIAQLNFIVEIPKAISCAPNLITWYDQNKNEPATSMVTLDQRFVSRIDSIDYDQNTYAIKMAQDPIELNQYKLTITPISAKRPFNSVIKIKATGKKSEEIIEQIFLFNSFSL